MPIHIEKGFDVLLEFELGKIFGVGFFPEIRSSEKNKQNLIPLFSHIRAGADAHTALAFEMHKYCGIRRFFIAGHATKYHLEEVLRKLAALGFEIYIILDLLSVMDEPSLNPYLLQLKDEYGVRLCLAGDCIPSPLIRPLNDEEEKRNFTYDTEEEE